MLPPYRPIVTLNANKTTVNESEEVHFTASADQPIDTWNWYKDGVLQDCNYDNFTTNWTIKGTYEVTVSGTNENGTSINKSITITVLNHVSVH